ncbi:LOW QUALITY PROTEIN: SPARC-related modular calcium-binding protein 1-like [Pomacea canaliculata]|uniref:LOW QUALITY PROTEIN: SPARC-related modular calcium-binding protein 1-like n=1 Tax=Pomacea canaliculata TaxID=400727 RepID=UPI000D72D3EF|nr:LOW QUALITY PROTEIN: SPARC-related modular calcium-binding protein 1-like [Pomacea canaliculata]
MARLAPSAHIAASAVCVFLLLMLGVQTTVATVTNTSSITTANGRGTGLKLSQVDGKSLFRSLRASTCSVDCSQSKVEYVCGTDDVTYTSRCELQRAKQCDGKRANGSRIQVRSKGRCPGDTSVVSKCFQERDEARKSAQRDDVLIPSCNADGTYSEVQCHTATRYCWCVTKDGRHIPGTSVREQKPQCKGLPPGRTVATATVASNDHRHSNDGDDNKNATSASRRRKRKGRNSKKKKKRKENVASTTACTSKERQPFNAALVQVFRDEYERMLAARGPEAVNDASSTDDDVSIEKKIVVWKFTQLDTNSDNVLSFKEIRSFRKMVKKLIKPRRCAKAFHRYCDKDNDRRIQKSEWTLCLGVDIKLSFRIFISLNSEGQTTDQPPDKPAIDPVLRPLSTPLRPPLSLTPLSTRPTPSHSSRKNRTADSNSRDCQDERQAAQVHAREEPEANIYIPRCQSNGLWLQAQCHEATEYCWCVEEDTGIPIPGTSTFKVEPNCTIRDDRQMKDCPFEQKRRFIVDLMADLTQEMNAANASQPSGAEPETTSARERVARWKLQSLDKNKNSILERQEWRDLRKTLKKNKNYPRKCRRQFLRYCDENKDKNLSLEEWRDCLGLNHNLFNSLPQNPKRVGQKNPFMDQLT